MTQALNLALFANNLNTSGQTSNAGLQNSAVTVAAGTAMSGGGAVSLGGTVTLNNAGVTSVTAGTGIAVSASTGAVTISTSGVTGTVTSVATGNGLSGGTITTTGTLTIAAPSYGSVGSYVWGYFIISRSGTLSWNAGDTFPAGGSFADSVVAGYALVGGGCGTGPQAVYNLSGTWRLLSSGVAAGSGQWLTFMVRVS